MCVQDMSNIFLLHVTCFIVFNLAVIFCCFVFTSLRENLETGKRRKQEPCQHTHTRKIQRDIQGAEEAGGESGSCLFEFELSESKFCTLSYLSATTLSRV